MRRIVAFLNFNFTGCSLEDQVAAISKVWTCGGSLNRDCGLESRQGTDVSHLLMLCVVR
jgi:hypothetical protein